MYIAFTTSDYRRRENGSGSYNTATTATCPYAVACHIKYGKETVIGNSSFRLKIVDSEVNSVGETCPFDNGETRRV
jgi:hypothetical protein